MSVSQSEASRCKSKARLSTTVIPPTMVEYDSNRIEVAIHRATGTIKRELDHYLRAVISPQGPLTSAGDVLIVTTCQESRVDLLNWDESSAIEKDRLLFVFKAFAEELCEKLRSLGYWADYADPASGLLMNSRGQVVWPEVQALERLRGYSHSMAGPCHILLHPMWQSRVYPATLFTNAPENELRNGFGV